MSDTFSLDHVSWVMNDDDLQMMIEVLTQAAEVVYDLETTGLEEYATTGGPINGGVAARISLATFTIESRAPGIDAVTYVLPLSHPDSPFHGTWRATLRTVMHALWGRQMPLIGHNVKFDCRWVYATTGVNIAALIVWDTQMSSHLLDENSPTRLKVRAPETFDVPPWDDFDLSKPGASEQVPLFQLGEYAARDTYWTWKLLTEHRRRMYIGHEIDPNEATSEDLAEARLGRVAVWAAMPSVAALTLMEQRGIRLDETWVRRELAAHAAERDRLLAEMASRYDIEGKPSAAPTSLWFMAWTNAAVAKGDLRITAMTRNGKPQWSKAVLIRQARGGSEVAQMILDQRGHAKRAEYLTSWLEFVTPDSAIHARYNAGRVVTGRLSSDTPNMQQVTKSLKPAFLARDGYVLVDIDYSQIELRVAAHVSGCQPMIDAFNRGDDLHTLLAAAITGKDPADVTPEERQAGKSANFGLLYGMSPYGFREYAETVYGVLLSETQAAKTHQTFFDTWTGMREWHDRQMARAHRTGEVTSPIGRIRRLPDIWDGNEKKVAHAERNAINSPVQGFASDLMQIASASIAGVLPGSTRVPGAYLVGTVHDSVLVEVREDDWEGITRECMDRMTTGVLPVLKRMDCVLSVPLACEATVSRRWGQNDIGALSA